MNINFIMESVMIMDVRLKHVEIVFDHGCQTEVFHCQTCVFPVFDHGCQTEVFHCV